MNDWVVGDSGRARKTGGGIFMQAWFARADASRVLARIQKAKLVCKGNVHKALEQKCVQIGLACGVGLHISCKLHLL